MEKLVNMEARYFKALLQVMISRQMTIFYDPPDKENLIRNTFEQGFLIPIGKLQPEIGWGVYNTRYITEDHNWLFGFLHKIIDSNLMTLPPNADSLKEVRIMEENIINITPFFLDFSNQYIYTQSHWRISRASKSTSQIWEDILSHILKQDISYLNVQSIPEERSFWEKMNKLKIVQSAQFELFGPNILNDKKIRELIGEFDGIDTNGIILILRNYLKGLKTETEDFMALLKYLLKGGGKGTFKGIEKITNKNLTVTTEAKLKEIKVREKLDESSSDDIIYAVHLQLLESEGYKQ
jgi:hypothetical protein